MRNETRFEPGLKDSIRRAVRELYGYDTTDAEISLQETRREFEGDVTLVVFPFIKKSGKSPEKTAQEIGTFLTSSNKQVGSFNVVKGFLNLLIDDAYWLEFFRSAVEDPAVLLDLRRHPHLFIPPGHLMVEYSSPNTNKPLHLGHIRNNLLGYSVSEILKAAGHDVRKVNLVNDRGIHICKSMLAWRDFGKGETPESSTLKGDHLVGKYYVLFDKKFKEQTEKLISGGMSREEAEKNAPIQLEIQEMLRKWEAGDVETIRLWKMMNGWVYEGFDETYRKLGVDFDKVYYESQTYLLGKKLVEEGLAKNLFFKKEDGSIWIDLSDEGYDEKLVLRGDGTSVYITQDLGTAQLRFDENPGLEKLIFVVGNEQEYHFKVLKEILRKLGRPWADGLFHLSYGMVDLPSGKMKSREGTVVDADDLIAEITDQAEMITRAQGKLDAYDTFEAKQLYHDLGMGALKYFILKVDPRKRMLFNPAESIDLNGNTGPFIQYTHARICSVLRKGSTLVRGNASGYQSLTGPEKQLLKLIHAYPEMLRNAALGLSPALAAGYSYEVAKAYNHFYHDHIVVDETAPDVSEFRIRLSRLTALVIKESLGLLGIVAPERM
ncbi:MAG: arginine--tRNA ligase [Bacteroidia bacterium]|nr:arginine--tRNA ligase [Bacteroidia bacterium]